MLAKRFVNQLSASDDYEELMISKLKVNSPSQYYISFARIFSKHVVTNIHTTLNRCIKIFPLVKV
jgi:hypothetical protein